jgi:putative chitinase
MPINRPFFYAQARRTLFDGNLSGRQVEGLQAILDEWEKNHAKKDDRWLAYMLATTHHETDRKMWPIEEYGRGRGRKYGRPDPQTGQVYYGRGFVQLTWKYNYEKMGRKLGADLVNKPERALELPIATKIMFTGMMDGSFTGKKLTDYLNPKIEQWVSARRIINGLDKAKLIASYATRYYASLSYTTG